MLSEPGCTGTVQGHWTHQQRRALAHWLADNHSGGGRPPSPENFLRTLAGDPLPHDIKCAMRNGIWACWKPSRLAAQKQNTKELAQC